MAYKYFKFLALSVSIFTISCDNNFKLSSLEKSYARGFEAYTGERWSKCIEHFEESIHLFKLFKSTLINCRLKCNSQLYASNIDGDIEDLKVYELFFKKRNCLDKCQEIIFGSVHIPKETDNSLLSNMDERKPYEYLHVCYFQMYMLPKAASAAYTYLVAHLKDDIMKHNLKYYTEQPEVDINEVVNLESEAFEEMYKMGTKSYKESKWEKTITSMEEVLTDYISWENRCRAECEYGPEQEFSPEIVKTLSNYMASLLQCKQKCQDTLHSHNYSSGVEFLADILNYLQISYYHLGRFDDAAKAVASSLLLKPDDEDMLQNKDIYSALIDVEQFVERPDILYYYKRDNYEKKILADFLDG